MTDSQQDKRQGGLRVCILHRKESQLSLHQWSSCTSGAHRHVSAKLAQEMVDLGQWEWIPREGWNGKKKKAGKPVGTQRAVRIVSGRTWKKTMSRDGFASTAVMQWVEGG